MLQQKDGTAPKWSTLGGEGMKGENAQVTFQRIARELLGIELKMKQIYPVYDYFHETLDKVNYVFYAAVRKSLDFNPLKENISSWITFGETVKLLFSVHTKQDVVVGERVIRLKERQDEAKELLHGI